jgi:HSP20 family protein
MTLIKYQNNLPNILSRFLENDLENWNTQNYTEANSTLPAVNIRENTEEYGIEVAVPGFDKNDFNINLDNDLLTISSEKIVDHEVKEDERFTRKEFSYQSFKRTFTLPELVEGDKITAKYENGILKIVIPKKEEAKPKPIKQIAVN